MAPPAEAIWQCPPVAGRTTGQGQGQRQGQVCWQASSTTRLAADGRGCACQGQGQGRRRRQGLRR
eukprot:4494050-Pyramimonas_sp.AAC.1